MTKLVYHVILYVLRVRTNIIVIHVSIPNWIAYVFPVSPRINPYINIDVSKDVVIIYCFINRNNAMMEIL